MVIQDSDYEPDHSQRKISLLLSCQWGSDKIYPVDVATMWSHWPYYRSVVNTLMVGLPLYQ